MPLLFSYGSLQEEAVQLSTFGRRLDGERAELLRFEGSFVKIDDPQEAAATGKTHHANITFNGNDDSRVPGMVFEISDTELAGADEYEAAFSYERVAAVLASGGPVWVYVHPQGALATLRLTLRPCFPAHILSLIEQPERFRRLTGLPAAARRIVDSWNGDLRAEERHQLERVIERAAFRREMEALSADEAADFAARGVTAPIFESEEELVAAVNDAIRAVREERRLEARGGAKPRPLLAAR